jgi:hypothetical protein
VEVMALRHVETAGTLILSVTGCGPRVMDDFKRHGLMGR